jgi:protein-S-isoprenylcysteine O-methyltransferase Ste14
MSTSAALPIYAYFGLILISRFFFRHRECVRAADGVPVDGAGGRRAEGALLCLLPLGLMQIAPLIEYWLRYWRIRGTPLAAEFFALVRPGNAAAGILLFAAGTLLAARASRQLARAWRVAPGLLFTGGLYAVIRHPLYAAYLVQGAGCMLMLGARWTWIALGVAAILIAVRISIEDRELAGRFPAFAEYARRVKRLIPGVF